jgi:glycosyltransferase involved in cell wall biosynthesis
MKLGFYYHIVLFQNAEGIHIPSYLGVFLDSLAAEVESLVLFGHEANHIEKENCDYVLKSTNISWVNLGMKTSFWHRMLFNKTILSIGAEDILKCNFLIVRAPSPLAPWFYFNFGSKVKIAYLMVGDYIQGLKSLNQPLKRKIPIYLVNYLNEFFQNLALKKSLTFVNSTLLFDKYKRNVKLLFQVKTTTLTNNDFFKRDDSFNNADNINVLFTGRISFSKGVLDLVEVTGKLLNDGFPVKLHIVGWEENQEKYVEKEMRNRAALLGMSDRIIFHGKKCVGPELFGMYRMAQIYVLPSQSDFEGFPRTIWEAMANSVPVVSTRVGSIPFYLENKTHILMIPPKDVESLYDAVKQVITNQELRKSLIENAYNFAKDVTLEKQTALIIKRLR